mmetsp:Transcript_53459/g.130599  ORF Transcript_53459/g.130599 Transcript_53459/m.130599 type:complete len:214 (+) Transcript_53459:83-724(+)|eukprot:CAMPEP_0206241240 /NCGR_PEP_ID=MMETSP0047_2-20121206/16388_1 /ASSEMBLY_ACC=CAM_ASM_000192 /TAXON_ID=195065 /ORGANISM="Chroomonas mesostigmatica_cf, Strain CCMP1168" /LENGTH=213 /DNA_ID=CAMNT_0053666119 /DNA_START=83 /DNA_END=727 /DNA_ORIENTATION=+
MASTSYALNAQLELKPERRDEFLKIILDDQRLTLSEEKGALQFVVGEDTTTPNKFYLHEQYVSEDAFKVHCAAPYFAMWQSFWDSGPFVVEPVVHFYRVERSHERTPVRPAICLNVAVSIKPEKRDRFLEVIGNNQKGTRSAEPLNLQYDFGENATEPSTFHLHEEYQLADDLGEGAVAAHRAAPHYKVWQQFLQGEDPCTKPPVISIFRTVA